MEKHSHYLDIASTAMQGLAMSAPASYEVIIQDFELPDMAGMDTSTKLLHDNPELPVIILIQISDQKMMGEAMDIGISQYLVKDDNSDYLEILPDIIARLIRRTTPLPLGTSTEATDLFNTLAQEAPIGIFYVGPDGITRYANKAMEKTTGYPAEQLVGSLWHTKIHPDDRDAITEYWLSKANTTDPWEAEFRFQRPDGSVARVVGLTNPLLDSNARVIGHVGTISDISEQHQANKELEETLTIQNAILSNIDEGLSLSDANGQIKAYNRQFLKINDFPPELLKDGATYEDLVRFNAERGHYGAGDIDKLVADRLAQIYASERSTSNKIYPDGRIVEIQRQRLPEGGQVITDRDITGTQQAEEQLRESEERYRQIADVSSDWVWEMDAKLRFSYFSEGYQRITGDDPANMLGKTRIEYIALDELEKPHWREHIEYLNAHQEFRDFQYQSGDPGGARQTIRINGVPILDSHGSFKGYRGTATDVTARVAEQQILAENTEKLRHAVELGKLGHYVWDGIAKKTLSCTEEYARIHGVSVDEYMAITISLEALIAWVHPDDREYYLKSIDQAVANQKDLELEYRIIARDGMVRYVREIFDPTYDDNGQLVQTAGAMQDITSGREVELALKDAERLAALGNWLWSTEQNKLLSCSEGFARVYGIPLEKVPEYMTRPGFGVVHEEDRDRLDHNFNKAMERGQGYEIEYRIVRPDGEIRDIQEIGEAINSSDGRCQEFKGTVQDITERKSVEREMSKAKTDAELANRSKSEFLSSMSHELRTPLNAILGFAQIMEITPSEPLSESQKNSVKHIISGGQHLLKLITQVLDFAKIETGEITMSIEPLDMDFTLSDCLSIANALAGPRDIRVIDKISGKGLPPIYADLTRIRQVLLNLISNGIKYNREGGSLTLEAEVTIDQLMRISVIDTGTGISKKDHDQVFEAFDRLGREAMEIEGTGIGLTISKQLVELMDGRISFSSSVDKGSTFWIEIPLAFPLSGQALVGD